MARKYVQFIALLVALGGCASMDSLSNQMADWQDDDVAAAIDAWGKPDDRQSFDDGEILVWRDHAAPVPPSAGGPVARPVVCERMLAVAPDGRITGWRWRGDAGVSISALRDEPRLVATTGTP